MFQTILPKIQLHDNERYMVEYRSCNDLITNEQVKDTCWNNGITHNGNINQAEIEQCSWKINSNMERK